MGEGPMRRGKGTLTGARSLGVSPSFDTDYDRAPHNGSAPLIPGSLKAFLFTDLSRISMKTGDAWSAREGLEAELAPFIPFVWYPDLPVGHGFLKT